jgi:hypothetical protein
MLTSRHVACFAILGISASLGCVGQVEDLPWTTSDGSVTPMADAAGGSGGGEDSGGGSPDAEEDTEPFSFFVTSLDAMRNLSGSQDGFGGNLGGLDGADAICQEIAAGLGFGNKTWRAFLSVTSGPGGSPVHAIDRIGEGPWYDRLGRLVAEDIAGLMHDRPDGDPAIVNDLPDEYGRPLSQFGDNHDVLTGSNEQGRLNSTDAALTCQDWTSVDTSGGGSWPNDHAGPMCGHSWPAMSGQNWIRAHNVPGCAAGVNLVQDGGGQGTDTVGGAGGYGGIYCFALTP